ALCRGGQGHAERTLRARRRHARRGESRLETIGAPWSRQDQPRHDHGRGAGPSAPACTAGTSPHDSGPLAPPAVGPPGVVIERTFVRYIPSKCYIVTLISGKNQIWSDEDA